MEDFSGSVSRTRLDPALIATDNATPFGPSSLAKRQILLMVTTGREDSRLSFKFRLLRRLGRRRADRLPSQQVIRFVSARNGSRGWMDVIKKEKKKGGKVEASRADW